MTSERESAITEAYNAVTGQDDESWGPDKTLEALETLWDRAVFARSEQITKKQINAERERQVAKGYTPAHDREHGIAHVLRWALHYGAHGEHVKAYALVEAALEIAPPASATLEAS